MNVSIRDSTMHRKDVSTFEWAEGTRIMRDNVPWNTLNATFLVSYLQKMSSEVTSAHILKSAQRLATFGYLTCWSAARVHPADTLS